MTTHESNGGIPSWVIMPVMSNQALTEAALSDCLAQSVPVRVLVILQGVAGELRQHIERIAEQEPRLLVWSHDPPLPSLSATWNRALQFVWAVGGTEALVVNNDVRLHAETYRMLRLAREQTSALFVSAVGVDTEAQTMGWSVDLTYIAASRGGPDFSCFLISKSCHERYRFDEGFVPLYGEDCDYHRRLMLAGDGDKIFSINLPYHHIGGGSQTLKALSKEQREALERRIGNSRMYYASKWGTGGINKETFTIPFDAASAQAGVTNPELQAAVLGHGASRDTADDDESRATPDSTVSC